MIVIVTGNNVIMIVVMPVVANQVKMVLVAVHDHLFRTIVIVSLVRTRR
jgi:hypothetical protein